MTKSKAQIKLAEQDRWYAIDELFECLTIGQTIFTVNKSTSRSGMSHNIEVFIGSDNRGMPSIRNITYLVSMLFDLKRDSITGTIRLTGCGTDVGNELVYNIGRAIYPEGFMCTGKQDWPGRCPSNEHSNGDMDYTWHRHKDGGYAFRHAWL